MNAKNVEPAVMVKAKLELVVQVPRDTWIDWITQYTDVFSTTYCGYWLRGVEHDPALGWLAYAHGGDGWAPNAEPRRALAIQRWKVGKRLPPGWKRLDEAAAVKAFLEGVKLWGLEWFDRPETDGHSYSLVIQMALLGKHTYEA